MDTAEDQFCLTHTTSSAIGRAQNQTDAPTRKSLLSDMKWILSLLCLIGIVARLQADTPDDQYLKAYDLIKQADSKDAQPKLAVSKYLEAQEKLFQIQINYPNWNPKALTFRLDYLAGKLEALGQPVSKPTPKAEPTAPPAPVENKRTPIEKSEKAPTSTDRPKSSGKGEPQLLPPDNTVEVPNEQRESANKARGEGLKYFIWCNGKEPFQRDVGGNTLLVPFCYVSNGDPIPFGTTFSVVRNQGNQLVGDAIQIKPDSPAYSSKGKTFALHLDFNRQYSGAGIAMISLHDLNTKKRISNEILVKVELR